MNICYGIVEIVEGVGQTTMLKQIVHFNPARYRSAIVTHRVKKYTSTLFENMEIYISPSYYAFFLDRDLVDYFRKFDIVVIKSGMPFFLAAVMAGIPTIYLSLLFQRKGRLDLVDKGHRL